MRDRPRRLQRGHFVAGRTWSTNLKPGAKAFQAKLQGQQDAFVARISGDGKTLLALTYLGGRSLDVANYLHEAKDGSIWVGGKTESVHFPTTANAWAKKVRAGRDAFLVHFDPKLSRMIYGTVFMAPGHVWGDAFHVDEKNNLLYIAGRAWGKIPTTTGALRTKYAREDAYLAVLDRSVTTKTTLRYASHIGGSAREFSLDAMSVDAKGIVTLTGTTESTDLPVTSGSLQAKRPGTRSGFLIQVDPKLSGAKGLVHGSYLGGSKRESGLSHVQDAQGRIHVLLSSSSSDLPTTKNKVLGRGASEDCYYAELDTSKTAAAILVYGSWVINGNSTDGSGWSRATLALHPKGVAFFVSSSSTWYTLPTLVGAFQRGLNGSPRGYLALLDTKTRSTPFLSYSSEYGGLSVSICTALGMAVHSSGDLLLVGAANTDLPMLPPVLQDKRGGGSSDGFVARLEPRSWGSRFHPWVPPARSRPGFPSSRGSSRVSVGVMERWVP